MLGKHCPACETFKEYTEFCVRRYRGDTWHLASRCRTCAASDTREYRNLRIEERLWSSARARAKRSGLDFNLTIDDIVVPDVCPVLGIPLRRDYGKRSDSTPSIDRVQNTRGYVRGNIAVISWRANRLKSDATPHEMAALYRYYMLHQIN